MALRITDNTRGAGGCCTDHFPQLEWNVSGREDLWLVGEHFHLTVFILTPKEEVSVVGDRNYGVCVSINLGDPNSEEITANEFWRPLEFLFPVSKLAVSAQTPGIYFSVFQKHK